MICNKISYVFFLCSIPKVLSAIFFLQVLVALVHSLINFYKTKNQVISINLPSVHEATFPLNNQAYNDDVATFKQFLSLSVFIMAIGILRHYIPKPYISKILSHNFGFNVPKILIIFAFCRRLSFTFFFLFIALIFYVRNSKLRMFVWKFSTCKCNEL